MLGSDIRELVIVKLEEYTPFGDRSGEALLAAGSGDLLEEVKPVYSYVDASLEEAANEALLAIPIDRLTPITKGIQGQGGSISDGMDLAGLQTVGSDGYIEAGDIPVDSEGYILIPEYEVDTEGYINASDAPSGQSTTIVDPNDTLIGSIVKPTDWLRLHTLQMAGWSRPVHVVIRQDNPLYDEQFSIYSRGNAKKPVVTDDGDALHYYSQPKSAEAGRVMALKYIPKFGLGINYPLDVAEAIALNVASKIYTIYGQGDQLALLTKDIESVFSTMKI